MKYLMLIVVSAVHAEIWNSNRKADTVFTINKDISDKNFDEKRYKPDWDDLDKRPLPQWYDQAKIGIFLHWGVFSVPAFVSEWFWNYWKGGNQAVQDFMKQNYPPGFTYQQFAPMFTAEFFDPDSWAKLFKKSGAKYIVLTSKHHEGFTLFPSKRSFSWNSVDVGPHRDLVGDLSKAVRSEGLEFGLYHSLFEWYNPMYLEDRASNFATHNYREDKLWPDIKQIVHDYKPSVIWSDGDWEAYDTYWNSTDLLAWLYNDSPVKDRVVVNDRWGRGTACKHGDFYNCEDRYHPGTLQKHKWENAFTIDSFSWGYRRNMDIPEILTIEQMLSIIVSTISCGGNALINVGPTKEGTIAPIFQERLLALGEWLSINGEAIYSSSPWQFQNDTVTSNVWYTCTKTKYNAVNPIAVPQESDTVTAIYAVFFEWPKNNILKIGSIASELHKGIYQVELLGQKGTKLNWNISNGKANIQLPDKATVDNKFAWTLKVSHK